MGVYVYVTKKSNPLRVKGLDAPVYKMQFACRSSTLDGGIFDTFLSARLRNLKNLHINRSIEAWSGNAPKYYTIKDEKREEGVFPVYAGATGVLWYDCDKPLGELCGYVYIKGKTKQFIAQEQFVALFREATGIDWTGWHPKVTIISPKSFAGELIEAYCKSNSIVCTKLNTAVAGCSKELEDCI